MSSEDVTTEDANESAVEGSAAVQDGSAAEAERAKKWYVATTYSNYENKVKSALQERIRQLKWKTAWARLSSRLSKSRRR